MRSIEVISEHLCIGKDLISRATMYRYGGIEMTAQIEVVVPRGERDDEQIEQIVDDAMDGEISEDDDPDVIRQKVQQRFEEAGFEHVSVTAIKQK